MSINPRIPISGARIMAAVRREDTVLRYNHMGDNWHASWASDDLQYVGQCDGAGFPVQSDHLYNSKLYAISGTPETLSFSGVSGYPALAAPPQSPWDPRYYGFGILALDGRLYQFLSTWNKDAAETDKLQPNELRFVGAKLIFSPDGGRTWCNQDGSSPVVWESWEQRSKRTMVFFEEEQEAFSILSILQMGRNYEFNRDGYLYVYAPNGNTEGTMNELVMFRTPVNGVLDRSTYRYFAGLDPSGQPKWSSDIGARQPVHTFPHGWVNNWLHPYSWQPSVVYNAPLELYIMANYGLGTTDTGVWFGKPSYLGLWSAKLPWGPWTQFHEETEWLPAQDRKARAYQPQIPAKWIAADGKSFWLVWTDYQGSEGAEILAMGGHYKKLIYAGELAQAERIRIAAVREYIPNYRFNAQRVDLQVT